jgi:hypothetical protein
MLAPLDPGLALTGIDVYPSTHIPDTSRPVVSQMCSWTHASGTTARPLATAMIDMYLRMHTRKLSPTENNEVYLRMHISRRGPGRLPFRGPG